MKWEYKVHMKVLLFGCGTYYRRYRHLFDGMQVAAIVDNFSSQKEMDGIPVLRPKVLEAFDFDCIYLLMARDFPVYQQLLKLGIPCEKIVRIHDLFRLENFPRPSFLDGCRRKEGSSGRCMLISNGLSRTGAPMVLFSVACIFRAHGYDVTVFSPTDGPLHQMYRAQGISVIVDLDMRLGRLDRLPCREYDFVWMNTVLFAYLLQKRRCRLPVFWWIHEAEKFYAEADTALTGEEWKGVHAFCVSGWAAQNFKRLVPQGSQHMDGIFPYGIPDARMQETTHHGKLTFAIIGTMGKIKGQAFFLSVWRRVFSSAPSVELYLVGGGDEGSSELREIQLAADGCENVRFLGELSHDEVLRLYSEIDVLVCPSMDDPLPVVATEAMMNARPCLVSDHTGTADFIKPDVNGWVFHMGDTKDLERKLLEIVAQKEHLPEVGRQARKCYEEHFSYAAFEKRVLEAAQCMMKEGSLHDE
ncbi:glycosyltransferase family 4 protein [uncultured Selenomonas sp.]|uniref:glycosyltransferase family 4 protein n=1 Tax=uncultured Selenomonas sp. TaxID=159275 RepID=UPI0025E5EA4D|nr:glycosyltransferase family 4 protein [uncultured Selenomonas sp.]